MKNNNLLAIKYRGKDFVTGEWVYGGLAWLDGNGARKYYITFTKDNDGSKSTLAKTRVKPESIGKITNLCDNNGSLWEGDIIEYTMLEVRCKGVVEFNHNVGEWQYRYIGMGGPVADNLWKLLSRTNKPANVSQIGNIHDNPELEDKGLRID